MRGLGAALGAASGPVAAYGQGWAGTGDGRVHIWVLATVCGALLGALTYPVFFSLGATSPSSSRNVNPFGIPFAALFGFAVGLVSGAFVAFPMGGVVGALGGALAGAVVAFAGKRLTAVRGGLAIASGLGAAVALFVAWVWLS